MPKRHLEPRRSFLCHQTGPMRVILKAVFLDGRPAHLRKNRPRPRLRTVAAHHARPGKRPTFDDAFPVRQCRERPPAMKGLSSGALAKTTSFGTGHAAAVPSCVSAASLMMRPICRTASMLMPALVVATFHGCTDTPPSGSMPRGMALDEPSVPLSYSPCGTSAEKAPDKNWTPTVLCRGIERFRQSARSFVLVAAFRNHGDGRGQQLRLFDDGNAENRAQWISPVFTRCSARRVILSYIRLPGDS